MGKHCYGSDSYFISAIPYFGFLVGVSHNVLMVGYYPLLINEFRVVYGERQSGVKA